MMIRREALTLIAAAMCARAIPLAAQGQATLPLVGLVFTPGPLARMLGPEPESPPARAFITGLRHHGWKDEENIVIDRRTAEVDPEKLASQFVELQTKGARVNVLAGARWIQDAAMRSAPAVPIVTLFHEDPVAAGLITSLARPGGGLTGVTSTTGPELDNKRLQLLTEMVPRASRVTFLGPTNQSNQFETVVSSKAVSVVLSRVDFVEQYEKAFLDILAEKPDALIVAGGPLNYVNAKRIVEFAATNKLPAIFASREAVENGGLMSYGASIPGAFRQMATMVDRILRGAKSGDVAVEQPTTWELIINLKAAMTLGISVPGTLLTFANELVE